MRIPARLGLALLVAALAAAGAGYWGYRSLLNDLPDLDALRDYHPPLVSEVWSRDGVLMAEFSDERRKVVDVTELPAHVTRAFIAAEDSQFFRHEGLDWRGILRAAWANLRKRRVVQGGSTITQQVAKSLLLSPERSFRRKAREAVLAIRMEKNLSKAEILHLYLNQIYLGHGAYGVESAAEIYFGISAAELSLAQASLLAGLPQAPSRYDPFQHEERARERQRYVLQQMVEEGWADSEAAARAAAEPLTLVGRQNPYGRVSPYFSEQVRQLLEQRYGAERLLRGGLKVVATMDARLQEAARTSLRAGLETLDRRHGYRGPLEHVDPAVPGGFAEGPPPPAETPIRALVTAVDGAGARLLSGGVELVLPTAGLAWALSRDQGPADLLKPGDVVRCRATPAAGPDAGPRAAELLQDPEVEGALVCLDPHSGEVLACVGGYDFQRSQFNRATQAQRQAGSAIKPLIYAAAIDRGYTPATLVYDAPIVYDSPDLDDKWKPKNYSEQFYGATTLREALVHSRNVVTIKVLRDIGVPYAADYLRGLGIESPISEDLSLALGASTVTPLELASVYGAFPTGGLRRRPAFLLQVSDRAGQTLEAFTPEAGTRTLSAETAYLLVDMMRAVIREGTGRSVRPLGRAAGGKTGTTNNNRDAWFLGFTPDLVTGVWVGYDDGRTLGRKETGGRAAAPIWLAFMKEAMAGRPESDFPIPDGIEFARIDATTGQLAGSRSGDTFAAAFRRGSVPEPERAAPLAPAAAGPAVDPSGPAALDALR